MDADRASGSNRTQPQISPMDADRSHQLSAARVLLLSALICVIYGSGPSSAAAGQYVYVEVFCHNPQEYKADAPRPNPNAPQLLSDPPEPPLVCRYFSYVIYAGRFRPQGLAGGGGMAPQEQVQESAAITKAASEAFDLHVRKPCKYKQVK